MYPELFRIGPVVIGSYGLMLASAFIAGIWMATRLAEQRGINIDKFINLCFLILISALIGSRLFYVLTHLDEFSGRWLYTFLPVQPDGSIGLSGLIFLGGFLAALLVSLFYVKTQKMPAYKVADSMAPALAFGLFVGRIGCFLNGCCFGQVCNLSWGVQFPATSAAGSIMGNAFLHPTQVYSSIYAFIIFAILMRLNRQNVADGVMSAAFLIFYGAGRFIIDFFRYYEHQMLAIGGLNWNQVTSILMIIGGVIIFLVQKSEKEKILPS
jgi:phosphatidylglycerol:prolipoprotein diacylglycerol transferase